MKVAKTIRKFRDGILAAIRLNINNARAEGLNNHVRLITRRAYGFHSPQAALALVMLSCGPIELHLPHERVPGDPHSCRESPLFDQPGDRVAPDRGVVARGVLPPVPGQPLDVQQSRLVNTKLGQQADR